ncbi:hypothetical protein TNCV_2833521 [Trichonephila clavipes]|nr:hypothetical protein TNCV_2833521 [Trichonephila clavipes]
MTLVDEDLYAVQARKKVTLWLIDPNQVQDMLLITKRVQALNLLDYLLRLPMGGAAMCDVAELHSSYAEQL